MKKLLKFVSCLLIVIFLFTQTAFAAEKIYFYHTDPVGTPLAMTDASGNVVWRVDYKPFGEEQSITGTIENKEKFVGKEKDDETGLYYFGARYMHDKIGRFTSPDPVGAVDPWTSKTNYGLLTNPQRLNPYAYGLNNPYRYVDPDGEMALEMLIPIVAIGGLVLIAIYAKSIEQAITNKDQWPMLNEDTKSEESEQAKSEVKGRSTGEKKKDIEDNPDKWEKVGEKLDPKQPKDGESKRELWRNKETGETLEKHVLRQKTPPRQPHPHYAEPKKERWGF